MYDNFTVHLLVEECLCFHFLAIVNRVSMNMAEQISVKWNIKSFGYMPKCGVVGSYGYLFENSSH